MKPAGVLHTDPPALSVARAQEIAEALFGVQGTATPLVSERDQNFRLEEPGGAGWVLKVSNAVEEPAVVEMEIAAIEHVAAIDPELPVPRARQTLQGAKIGSVPDGAATHLVRLIPYLPGRHATPTELDERAIRSIGETTARLSKALRGFFHPAAGRAIEWDQKHLPDLARHAALIEDQDRRRHLERVLGRFTERVVPALTALRAQVIHNDVTLDNLLLDEQGRVSGIIDFGDMAHTALVLDVPATLQSLVREREDIFAVAADFLPGFTSVQPLEVAEAELLADLLAGRMAQTILISAWRTRQFPDNAYITGWTEPAWALLGQLAAVGMDEAGQRLAELALAPIVRGRSAAPPPDEDLRTRRARTLGTALEELSYARPLHLVRASGAYMYDADGRAYLDAYNNVPVVGHSHARVGDAIARQAALLNTNTRYLHATIVELAERIVAGMPPGLDTVMFVNSGSEANDLAWRLATTATGGDAGLVVEWAYHGATSAVADFTPSEWPRGERPPGVETFPAPDTFRGPYAGAADGAALARDDMAAAIARLADRGRRPAALFLDSLFTSSGIFVPQAATVAAALEGARAAGALVVADEVQAGHGRSGEGLWTFPAWGLAPDVVTLGKPMGNGHPVAAVVTRAEIADRMAAETTFFSTFGGNPVACIAALTVLDVLEDERLVENAASVGTWLRDALSELAQRHPVIGDVRGRGLMIGVELLEPDGSLTPARDLARRVRDEMREKGVLIGTTRREKNVLKIRPPLCIGRDEAGLIVGTLDEVLAGS
ncbi:MAG TPA: aminotransferase class III-fold pyridoxal phosphate-dependent enzyme [Candidatus Limnocylindria bacterium]|nr:aminotransferase class III-fold pyridoxal phosphate-dependent enzyme [Candidatus Limnocylindria bacterium]